MKNITIILDEKLLESARAHASRLGCSFNSWLIKIITDAIKRSPKKSMAELLNLADSCAGSSNGSEWSRDDICKR